MFSSENIWKNSKAWQHSIENYMWSLYIWWTSFGYYAWQFSFVILRINWLQFWNLSYFISLFSYHHSINIHLLGLPNIRFYYDSKVIVDVYRTKESSWLQSRNVIVQKWQPFFTSLWVFWMCQFFASWEC